MQILKCLRCGHEWASRKLSRPERCASCTVAYWWRPARIPKIKPVRDTLGRPHKYPVNLLNVGQVMTLPHDAGFNPASAKQAITMYARRHGRQFVVSGSVGGLRVQRVL